MLPMSIVFRLQVYASCFTPPKQQTAQLPPTSL